MVKSTIKLSFRLIWPIFILCFSPARAQIQYSYGVNTGLPSANLYNITTDKNNLIWIASDNGIFSFNGYDYESIALENNDVLELAMDSEQRLWGLNSSAGLFYVKDRKVYNQKNTPWIPAKLNAIVAQMAVTKDALYIGHGAELTMIKNNRAEKIHLEGSEGFVLNFVWENGNSLFAASTTAIHEVQNGANKIVDLGIDPIQILDVVGFNDTTIILTKKALFQVVGHNSQYLSTKICDVDISEFDKGVRLYLMGTKPMLYEQRKLWEILPNQKKLKLFFTASSKITGVCEDQYKNVWVSTFDEGLIMLPERFRGINQLISFNPSEKNIGSFYKKNNLLLGLIDGKVILDNNIISYNPSDRSVIRAIVPIKNNIVIGTDAGLYAINSKSGKVNLIDRTAIKKVQSYKSMLYYGSNAGLFASPEAVVHKGGAKVPKVIYGLRVYSFVATDDHTLWASTINGFYKFKNGDSVKIFVEHPEVQSACPFVVEISTEYLAIITGHNLIYLANKSTGKINLAYKIPSGVRLNHVICLDSKLFLASNKGIIRLALDTKLNKLQLGTSFLFDRNLFDADIRFMQQTNDSIFFMNSSGIFGFNIGDQRPKNGAVALLYSAKTTKEDLPIQDVYTLKNNNRHLTLTFYDPTYSDAQLYYRINTESDAQWQKMSRNVIQLPELSMGTYNISVATSMGYGLPMATKDILLQVKGKMYEYAWFKISAIGLIMLFGVVIFLFWQRKQNLEKSLKQELLIIESNLKLTSLQSQMNPHFLRNCLNSIQALIQTNQRNKASAYISHFSELIEHFIHLSGKNFIPIEQEIEIIRNFVRLEQLRFNDEFDFKLEISDLTLMHLEVPTMFLQPIVENAIEHGLVPSRNKVKSLLIETLFDVSYQKLTILVMDNGIGITANPNAESNSIALNNIRKRIDTINSFDDMKITLDIFDNSEAKSIYSTGTTVTLAIEYIN